MATHAACDPEALRTRALAGDATLLADLFTCFRGDLLAFLRQRCGDSADAEDAAQDAFVSAARWLDGYRGETAIRSWLYRLASSACTRMRRGVKGDRRRRVSLDSDPMADAEIAAVGPSIEARLDAHLGPLQVALEALSPTDRAVLLLRDGEGQSAKEVAAALGLTEGAVKSRLHRARRGIRHLLVSE